MKPFGILVVSVVLAALLVGGCGSGSSGKSGWAGEYPIQVVATTTIVGEMVKAVGRDNVVTKPLMAPGTDPHTFRPSGDDDRLLATADAVVANGLGLEAEMRGTLAKAAKDKPFLAIGERLPQSRLIETGRTDSGPTYDPHVWLDVALFSEALDAIAEWLGEMDPSGARTYRANASEYKGQLRQLHEITRNRFAGYPADRRAFVASHGGLAYFARAYGLETAPSAATAQDLAAFVANLKKPVLLSEDPAKDAIAQEVVSLAEARGITVTVSGPVPMESLGVPRSATGSYTSMIEQTATRIAEALGSGHS